MYRRYKIIVLWIGLILSAAPAQAQGYFKITPDLEEAYELSINLRLEEAQIKIDEIKKSDPENALVYHIENYIDFFKVFVTEEEKVFKQLKKNKDYRLDKIKKADKLSPYYRFSQAEINLQWALVRLKFNERFTAAKEVYSAYGLLEKNRKLYPDFLLNYKSLSVIHVLAKNVPGVVRFVFSINGSIAEGTQEIKTLVEQEDKKKTMFADEAHIIYAYILHYQNNEKSKAWEHLRKRYLDKKNNPLLTFIVANLAQKNGYNDQAIQLLENRSQDARQLPFHYLNFLLGKFKLYRNDNDADTYILDYLDNFRGEHFIKEAHQKLAWHALIMEDDLAKYKKHMRILTEVGSDLVDEDKQAKKEAKENNIPHPDLLKARLLFDGAYYRKAYDFLVRKAYIFQDETHVLEYNYRMGRITQMLKNYPEAIEYFVKSIQGKPEKSYMRCNAALQISLILEQQGKPAQALKYLEQCLDMNPDQYKASLHQKAKSARQRIQERQ